MLSHRLAAVRNQLFTGGDRPKPAVRGGWVAVLLAALLAFTWQSFLTQTHEHFASRDVPAAASATTAPAHLQSGRAPANPADTCPICREIAQAGHYLLPPALALCAPPATGFWLSASPTLALTLSLRSHAWQSRAPPTPLQA
jgi:hypothetical protein